MKQVESRNSSSVVSAIRTPRLLAGVSLAGAWSCACAGGATLVEDFSYSDALASAVGSSTGGWGGKWSAGTGTSSDRTRVIDDYNLTYQGGGYGIIQSGTGRFYGNFGSGSIYGPFRSANRVITTGMSGTVWFSFLVQATDLSAQSASNVSVNGLQFNKDLASSTRFGTSPFRIELQNQQFQVVYGDVTNPVAGTFTFGTTHLVVGKMEIGAGNDTLSVWFNPTDLLALGSPAFTGGGQDMGEALGNVGAIGYGTAHNLGADNRSGYGSVDALRISDGDGDGWSAFVAVTGVPEPSTLAMSILGSGIFLRRKRNG